MAIPARPIKDRLREPEALHVCMMDALDVLNEMKYRRHGKSIFGRSRKIQPLRGEDSGISKFGGHHIV